MREIYCAYNVQCVLVALTCIYMSANSIHPRSMSSAFWIFQDILQRRLRWLRALGDCFRITNAVADNNKTEELSFCIKEKYFSCNRTNPTTIITITIQIMQQQHHNTCTCNSVKITTKHLPSIKLREMWHCFYISNTMIINKNLHTCTCTCKRKSDNYIKAQIVVIH